MTDDRLALLLSEGVKRGVFAGAGAAVADERGIVAEAYAGAARFVPEGEQVPAGTATLWDLASLTKPLAGTALLLALEGDGLLDLADDVARYEDSWKRTALAGVTLRHLLLHTAGCPPWYPLYVRGEGRAAYRRTLGSLRSEGPPGLKVRYSCVGFLFLADVVEQVGGAPVDRLFRERVAGPLGLSGDLLFAPQGAEKARAAGGEADDETERQMVAEQGLRYDGFRRGPVNGEVNDGNAFHRDGGLSLNAGLFGTVRAVAGAGRAWLSRERRLLPERSVGEAIRNQTAGLGEDRGLGWALASSVRSAGARIAPDSFGHTGFTGSSLFVDPRARRVYVLLANRLHPSARSAGEMIAFRSRFHETVADG